MILRKMGGLLTGHGCRIFCSRLSLWAASESCFGSAHRAGKQRLGDLLRRPGCPRMLSAMIAMLPTWKPAMPKQPRIRTKFKLETRRGSSHGTMEAQGQTSTLAKRPTLWAAPTGQFPIMCSTDWLRNLRSNMVSGESNAGRSGDYGHLFSNDRDLAGALGAGRLSFYWVQLADFYHERDHPIDSDWARLREAQTTTLSLPNTGQAVIIDAGEGRDIHPRNKRVVGDRLARHAQRKPTVWDCQRVHGCFDGNQGRDGYA